MVALLLALAAAAVRLDREPPRTRALAPGTVSGFAEVIDGDSLRIAGAEVRLEGIDAPEGRQTCRRDGAEWDCGEEARRALTRLIGGTRVTCRSQEIDKHGRHLGTCEAGAVELNRTMVASGMAVAFGRAYVGEERAARAERKGLWAGEFQLPRDWRHERGIGR